MEQVIEKTLENLRKNNMDAYYAENVQEALGIIMGLLHEGDKITCGGSVTLYKSGVLDMLKSGPYEYYDRYEKGITPEQINEIFRKAFYCDAYIMSSNAITENGELYNVDGNSNRVAPLLFGPDNVIILAGKNKIVPTIEDAVKRVKTIAAPKNAARLKVGTPCSVSGICMSLSNDDSMLCDGCRGDNRICCNYVVSAKQRKKGRIKVIIMNEDAGY